MLEGPSVSLLLTCAILLKFLLVRVILKFNEMTSTVLVRFLFNLTQDSLKWEEEFPLTKCLLHQFACIQVCGAFLLLVVMVVMMDIGGPSTLWAVLSLGRWSLVV